MANYYVGQIVLVGFNFAPSGFLLCDGSLQPISQYDVLFNLIGTTYGGDGQTTFAVPDLRGRVPIHQGNGYVLAQKAGTETVTLLTTEMPGHTHTIDASQVTGALACRNGPGTSRSPVGNVPAIELTGVTMPYSSQSPDVAMGGSVAGSGNSAATGSSQPHDNMQPYTVLNYCIASDGIFPSQT